MGASTHFRGNRRGNFNYRPPFNPMMGPRGPPFPPRPFPPGMRMPPMPQPGLTRPPRGMMGPRPRMPPHPGMRMRPPLPPPPGPHFMRGMGFRRGAPPGRGRFMGVASGRVTKKSQPVNEMDLSKEWVTAAIKEEFMKKDQLLTFAKNSSNNEEAWAEYRSQRNKCGKIYHEAKLEFIGNDEDDKNSETETSPQQSSEFRISINML